MEENGNDFEEDKRRLFEYFIVAGLDDTQQPQELTAQPSADGKPAQEQLAPITDICLIFTSEGETIPPGFERIETTPQGYPANLNHGSLRSPAAFLCYKRGYQKPPLIDLGVLDEGKGEKPMLDAVIVDKTPYGLQANISNSSSALYFTTRRAKPDAPPHQLVITNICVILENKGEHPPHTFYKIPKNLNKSMIGSEVYVCYKKTQMVCKRIAYEPAVLDCFPRVHNIEDSLLVRNVPMFFLPMGALIEAWPERCKNTEQSARTVSTCVFTDEAYTKYYGASITFYEPYTKPMSDYQLEKLDLGNSNDKEDKDKEQTLYYCNKAICVVSRYPFFEPFRRFLFFLLNTTAASSSASNSSSRIPIERYISYLMYEVPFPSPARPRVLMELGSDMIAFESSDDSQIPLSGASFVETLKCLGTENLLYAMLLTLLEQKILVHSLRPWLLACVAETLCALMFPFSWNLPYIPQCPLPLAGIFHAPLSFMAGVDSRYFDLYEEPPTDVTCFDLDTATISQSAVRKLYQLSMLPKKPLKRLRAALDEIGQRVGEKPAKKSSAAGMDYEQTHQRRMQSELAIREAFLRFMCALMDGYTDYLCPMMDSPRAEGATDVRRLFDWEPFLLSRDKHAVEFYTKLRDTTCFNRFIEERSGAVVDHSSGEGDDHATQRGDAPNSATGEDKSVHYVFFDDCIAKLRAELLLGNISKDKGKNGGIGNGPRLLDGDSMMANRTVVVPAPHMHMAALRDRQFTYASFPQRFTDEHFETEHIARSLADRSIQQKHSRGNSRSTSHQHNHFLLRTRQEIRKALSDATLLAQQNAAYWPRSVLFFAYTLWFMQLPALIEVAKNKRKILLLGLRVLSRMEQIGVPFHDQICYRLLMHLCGVYNRPEMAITILKRMLNLGIIPNAITYKVYHKALIQSDWPSELRLKAIHQWRRLQLRLEVCARFRASLPNPVVEHRVHDDMAMFDNSVVEQQPLLDDHEENNGADADRSNIVQEIVQLKIIENDETVAEHSLLSNDNTSTTTTSATNNANGAVVRSCATTTDPLGAELPQHPAEAQNAKLLTATPVKSASNPYMSPSREKFIREHSASPFSARDPHEDNNAGGGKQRKRKSLRMGSSWLKSLANTSLVSGLIHRSYTTEKLDTTSHDGSVISSETQSFSTTSATSPSFLSLANKMRKKAMRTYNEMGQGVNELLERSGLNPTQMFKEARLNLSRSYRGDQSVMSTSSSDEHLFANDLNSTIDFFFACAQRSKDLVSIHYWMRDILPEEDSELRSVWLRQDAGDDPSLLQEDYLDVLVCSASPCSNCERLVQDDDLTVGWSVDDANMNTRCPNCQHTFLPSLKVCIQARKQPPDADLSSAAKADESNATEGTDNKTAPSAAITPTSGGKVVQSLTIPYISPLVLRRELETLVTSSPDGPLVLAHPSMRISHPIIFWNLFYYCRRLELPTHLLTWVSPAVVIHCVQDLARLPTTMVDGHH